MGKSSSGPPALPPSSAAPPSLAPLEPVPPLEPLVPPLLLPPVEAPLLDVPLLAEVGGCAPPDPVDQPDGDSSPHPMLAMQRLDAKNAMAPSARMVDRSCMVSFEPFLKSASAYAPALGRPATFRSLARARSIGRRAASTPALSPSESIALQTATALDYERR
jgi:hypothetical protein